jgi:hypothetical protein
LVKRSNVVKRPIPLGLIILFATLCGLSTLVGVPDGIAGAGAVVLAILVTAREQVVRSTASTGRDPGLAVLLLVAGGAVGAIAGLAIQSAGGGSWSSVLALAGLIAVGAGSFLAWFVH